MKLFLYVIFLFIIMMLKKRLMFKILQFIYFYRAFIVYTIIINEINSNLLIIC